MIYIPGNHDEVARDYLGLLVGGVELVAEYEHHTADGRRFLVTHGDELDSAVKCGGWLTGMFGDWMYDVLLFANRWTNRLRRRLNYPYWSLANFLKPRIGQAAAHRPFRSRRRARGSASGLRRRDLRPHPPGGVAGYRRGMLRQRWRLDRKLHRAGRASRRPLEVLHWVDETARCRCGRRRRRGTGSGTGGGVEPSSCCAVFGTGTGQKRV